MKYGRRDFRGSGRASARETLARVAAGAIALKFLKTLNIEVISYVEQIGPVQTFIHHQNVQKNAIESSIVRCPDPNVAPEMIELIEAVKREGDSIGGVIKGVIRNMIPGLGEPVFDKLHADLGKAMLSINAVKGFEIGSGFSAAFMRGSEHNDAMRIRDGRAIFSSNHAGGILGGISTGEDMYFRVAFKPVSTLRQAQQTVNGNNEEVILESEGRHDPCVLPRAVPIVDAMAAIVIMDHYLRQQATQQF